jgi:hypothetical protein
MATTQTRIYRDHHELALENTVLRLCAVVVELTAAVDRLAVKEHYAYQDEARSKEEFEAILQSLTKVKRQLQVIADSFVDDSNDDLR